MMFKELKEKVNNKTHHNVATKKEKNTKNIFFLEGGMINYSQNFAMRRGFLEPNFREKR